MAAGVGAAAIWKERTGEGQEVKVDLRKAIYNTNSAIAIIMQKKRAAGLGAEERLKHMSEINFGNALS